MFGDPNGQGNNETKLSEIVHIKDECRKPLNDEIRSSMKSCEQLYPYYGANGKVDEINDYMIDFTALCVAEDGGYWGADENSSYIVNGPCWVNNHAPVIVPKEVCDIVWLMHLLNFKDLTRYITGSTRGKLTQGALAAISISLPSINLQHCFADFVRVADKSKFISQRQVMLIRFLYNTICRSRECSMNQTLSNCS